MDPIQKSAKSALLARRGGTLPALVDPMSNVPVCVTFSSSSVEQAFLAECAAYQRQGCCQPLHELIHRQLCPLLHEPIQPPMTDSCLKPKVAESIDPSMKAMAENLLNETLRELNHYHHLKALKLEEIRQQTLTKKVCLPERSVSLHGAAGNCYH